MPFLKHSRVYGVLLVCLVAALVYAYTAVAKIPTLFPVNGSFVVEEDESLRSVSVRLEKEGFINSALLFRMWVSFFGHDRHIQLGGYQFKEALTLPMLVEKMANEKPDLPLVKVTIPEGSTNEEVAGLLAVALPHFSTSTFAALVLEGGKEGTLFPSTYFLLPSTSEKRSVQILTDTFAKKYRELFALAETPHVLKNAHEVLVLASIVEGEAKADLDKRIIAGILLSRLEKNMPLQVDVAKETYRFKGLPNNPINNPGTASIASVYNPERTKYLFYITGNDGKMYYAKTFDEHKKNIAKYLR